jgi:hypothetical protein
MAEMLHDPGHALRGDAVDDELAELGRVQVDQTLTTTRSSGGASVESMLRARSSSSAPRTIPAQAMAGAVSSWFAIVFAVSYLLLPALATGLGLYSGMIANIVPNFLALATMAMVTTGLAVMTQPRVVTNVRAGRDPVVAAGLGSLLVWAGAQEFLPILQSLSAMPLYESLTFIGLNVVEAGLFGMMLASFTRSPVKAFALGAAFQSLLLAFFIGWI